MKDPHPHKGLSINKDTFRYFDQMESSSVKRLLSQRFLTQMLNIFSTILLAYCKYANNGNILSSI